MERKNIYWLTIFIVAAFAICGGFVAGSLLSLRERGLLKAKYTALAQTEAKLHEQLSDVEGDNSELYTQLDQARSDVAQCRAESGRTETDKSLDPASDFHPPMALDFDSFETESRIVELECEVASLKELVSRNRTVSGPPSNPSFSGTTLTKVAERPAAREQCSAITQKGTRCSRPARSNGKCWQHGG